jgi:hypothetical protein
MYYEYLFEAQSSVVDKQPSGTGGSDNAAAAEEEDQPAYGRATAMHLLLGFVLHGRVWPLSGGRQRSYKIPINK